MARYVSLFFGLGSNVSARLSIRFVLISFALRDRCGQAEEGRRAGYGRCVATGGRWDGASDAALVEAVGARDQTALQEAYRRHGPAVWAVARRLCGAGDRAERVCAGVFTELWSRGLDVAAAAGRSLKASLVVRAYGDSLEERGVHRDPVRDAVLLVAVGGCALPDAARLLGVSDVELRAILRQGMSMLRRTDTDAEEVTR
jgi:DNA-directed RNA polymerase specialized sigma24 family protein